MSAHVPLFQFRLPKGVSIGPGKLKEIWFAASGLRDVSVAREFRRLGTAAGDPTYSLSGPSGLDLPGIEMRLRRLLQEALMQPYIELKRLA